MAEKPKKTMSIQKESSGPILQLVERVGMEEAARLMGVDKNNFRRWADDGEARQAYVMAAKYLLSKMDRQTKSTAIAIVVVPSGQRQAFDAIVKGLNLDTKYVVR